MDQWPENSIKLKLVFFKKLTINLTENLFSLHKGDTAFGMEVQLRYWMMGLKPEAQMQLCYSILISSEYRDWYLQMLLPPDQKTLSPSLPPKRNNKKENKIFTKMLTNRKMLVVA